MNGRVENILCYVARRNVLDIGSEDMNGKGSLSKEIEKYAKSVTRVDIKKGQNFETYNLKSKFDCIVAGEVVEHIDNLGLFLENCKKHLNASGFLVITTPNPYGIYRVVRHVVFGSYKPDESLNPAEHTCIFTFAILKRILKRHGFAIEKELYVNHEKYIGFWIPRFRNTLFVMARNKTNI